MHNNSNLYPSPKNTTEKAILAGGALTALIFLGGCSSPADAKIATDDYARANNVSTSCVGSIRARLTNQMHDTTNNSSADLTQANDQACLTADHDKVLMVAGMVRHENKATNSNLILYELETVGACVLGAIGIAIYSIAKATQPE